MPAVAHSNIILSNVLPWSGIDIQYFEYAHATYMPIVTKSYRCDGEKNKYANTKPMSVSRICRDIT